MSTNSFQSLRGIIAAFVVLMSALLVVTVAVDVQAAAAQTAALQDITSCTEATPEGCFDTTVECDAVTQGQGVLTVAYIGEGELTSVSTYADGLGGFYSANELPALFTLTDGSWNVSAFVTNDASERYSYTGPLWVSCGYVCETGQMDSCASSCDVDGIIVADECFVGIAECVPNGAVHISLGLTTAALVAASPGDWQVQLTTYSSNMQISSRTVTVASTSTDPFVVDPLPNGDYRVVLEMESLSSGTTINGAVSATIACTTTPCPAGECVFEFLSAEFSCTGTLWLVIVGEVPVLNVNQIEPVTVVINGVTLPTESIIYVTAIDQLPPYPNGDGIRESIYINVVYDPITPAETFDIVATIAGSSIYNQTFAATIGEQISGTACVTVTVDCATQTVQAAIHLPPVPGEPGWYETPDEYFEDPVTLIVYDANGFVVDWAPKGADYPDLPTDISNPLVVSLAAGTALPLQWQVGRSIDWGFFTDSDVNRLANGELREVWMVWDEGTIECDPPSIDMSATAVACTSVEPNGSILLTPTLSNGATLASISLDYNEVQLTTAPFQWDGLPGGVYTFTVAADPVTTIEPVTVPDCPNAAVTFSVTTTCASREQNGTVTVTVDSASGASFDRLTLAGANPDLIDFPGPFVWTNLAFGDYRLFGYEVG